MKSNAIFGRRPLYFGLLAAVACLLAPATARAASDPATQAGLIPHKSLYEIKMISTRNSSQFQNLSGQMYYEWQPSC